MPDNDFKHFSTLYFLIIELAAKNLHLVTIFLRLVAKRRPKDFFNFEPCTDNQLINQSVNQQVCKSVCKSLCL